MFTGIVQEVGVVKAAPPGGLSIAAGKVLRGMEPGDSIAVNGACLTITGLDTASFSVDVVPETLRRTNLGLLKTGDYVNLEAPLAMGGKLSGHLVQGHVDGTARVVAVVRREGEMIIKLDTPPEMMRYVVEKGFVAVDGISLTVANRDTDSFRVSIVDYTRQHTTLGNKKVGDTVNLEVDIIAKYVAQLSQPQRTGITVDFLQEHGFLVS